ncbi:MAG TPA: magnesium transporter [Chloroflexota bacterium]|nr:magnesium transporter [Chloroflexota bacterium]
MDIRTVDVREVLRAALSNDHAPSVADLRAAPPEELARALAELTPHELGRLVTRLGDESLAELIAELDPFDAARLLGKLGRAQAADVLEEMDPDDAADVVGELAVEEAEAILVEMEHEEAEDVRDLLSYPPESAAGIMTPDYVAVAPDLTAAEALAALGRLAEEAETIYYVYVTDPRTRRLLGVLSLRNLVLSPRSTPVRDLMITDVAKVRASADQEEAARLLDQRSLIALPVVDDEDRLLGIITADDAADVLFQEATEDIERLGGSQPLEEPYLRASVFHLFRKRIVWLLVLFVAEAYTGTVLRHFEDTLSEMVSLAFFIPLLIGTGGNVGSQTVTTLVRAMGVGEVQFRDLFRVFGREMAVGSLLGAVMGLATYVRAWTLGVGLEVGPAVAVAALFIVVWAAMVAAILPLVLRRLRVDPAVVSAPFITTLVDGTGLFLYFTIARIMLGLD